MDITSSGAPEVVVDAPETIALLPWLFSGTARSSGETVSAPENSQMTAAAFAIVDVGTIVMDFAPGKLFLAYQTSTIEPAAASIARAPPA